jgi:hypothetical protein
MAVRERHAFRARTRLSAVAVRLPHKRLRSLTRQLLVQSHGFLQIALVSYSTLREAPK